MCSCSDICTQEGKEYDDYDFDASVVEQLLSGQEERREVRTAVQFPSDERVCRGSELHPGLKGMFTYIHLIHTMADREMFLPFLFCVWIRC